MHLHVFVVVRLGGRRFAAEMANMRFLAGVHLFVLGKVVAAREQLAAHAALVRAWLLVLAHVPDAVVLAYKLATAHVARVRPTVAVGAQVRIVVRLVYVRLHADLTLVRLGRTRHVRPLVQLQIPLGAEGLRALATRVRLHTLVDLHVSLERGVQVGDVAHRAGYVLDLLLIHPLGQVVLVVPLAHVPGQTSGVHEALDAERTLFGLLVVNLLVPHQLHLAVEHLAAVANEVLQLALDVEVQVLLVLLVVGVALEIAVAQVALDRAVAGMDVHVFGQLLLGDERLVAHVARVRLDLHVSLLVQHVARSRMELLAARHALVRVHLKNMLLVLFGGAKVHEASRAHAVPFPDTVHRLQVLQQQQAGGAGGVAYATDDALGRVVLVFYVIFEFTFYPLAE